MEIFNFHSANVKHFLIFRIESFYIFSVFEKFLFTLGLSNSDRFF
jgi:hypothetical protein